MNPDQIEYWDAQATRRSVGTMSDNIWKRQQILKRLLNYDWSDTQILDIGAGLGNTAAALKCAIINNFKYIGTDISSIACEQARHHFGLNVVQADTNSLPIGKFDRIWAFDSLEHVNPEERDAAYIEIGKRLKKHGTLFMNVPMTEDSRHSDEYDHPYTLHDVLRLADVAKFTVKLIERYSIYIPVNNSVREYYWVEMYA